jgi:hypothetical protein
MHSQFRDLQTKNQRVENDLEEASGVIEQKEEEIR